jgi:GntR family transcriptional regulator, arabinose operon transcriptional repressor
MDEPRYQQVKRELLDAIARGEYEPDRPFITQRQVCERFGVSTTTAVRALNDLVAEGVLVRQQGRGTFVAERAGEPEPGVPSVPAERKQDAIALVIHGRGPIKSGIITGVESVCADLGIQMVLFDSKDSLDVQERALWRAIESGVSGVTMYAVQASTDSPALRELRRLGVPVVLIDRYLPDVATDAVIADHFAVGYELTSYLIAQGHQRMAMLWDETEVTSVRDRLSGHLRALDQHGLPVRPDLTLLTPHQKLPRPERIARLTELLEHPEPPTVLICGDGYIVARVAYDLADMGIEVPRQVELAGLDDAGPHNILPLTVAAAAVPAEEMGRQAMRLLAERVQSPGADAGPRRLIVPIGLQTRESSLGYLHVVTSRTG